MEFLYISTFPSPSPPLGSSAVFIFHRDLETSSSMLAIFAPITTSVIYILSRVFSFITYRTPTDFSHPRPGPNNTFDSPPVYSTPLSTPGGGANASFSFSPLKYRKHSMLLSHESRRRRRRRRELLPLFPPSPRFSLLPMPAQRKGSGVCTRIRGERARTNARSRKFTYT